MRLETGGLGIAANSRHLRNGKKKAPEERSRLARHVRHPRLWMSALVHSAEAVRHGMLFSPLAS